MTQEEHQKILAEIDYKKTFGDRCVDVTASEYSAKRRQQVINERHDMLLLYNAEYKKSYDEYMKERDMAYDDGMKIFNEISKNMKIFGR